MSAPLRIAMNAVAGALVVAALALGGLWHADRGRRWEEPRWTAGRFVALRPALDREPGKRSLWLLVVNPRCDRCVTTLRRVQARWARARPDERLAVLIVDSPARPGAAILRGLPPVPVWWDRDHVWRKRWGHRLYGELIGFDAAGRHLGTVAGEHALRLAGPPALNDPTAPVTHPRGGT
jgi:hypothetical protein